MLEDIRVPGYEVTGNVALYEVGGPEVSQPQHKVVAPELGRCTGCLVGLCVFYVPIPKCDECVLAEEDRLGPAGRLGELGEHDPGAETLRVRFEIWIVKTDNPHR